MKISIQRGLGKRDTGIHRHHPPSPLPSSSLVLFLSPRPSLWLLTQRQSKPGKLGFKLVTHTLGICNSPEGKKKLLQRGVGGGGLATCLSDNPPHPHPNTAQIHRFFLNPLLLPVPGTLSNLTLNPNNTEIHRASAVQERVSQ